MPYRKVPSFATTIATMYCLLSVAAIARSAELPPPKSIQRANVPLIAWISARPHALSDTLPEFHSDEQRLESFSAFAESLSKHDWAKATSMAAALSYELVLVREAGSWFVIASDDAKRGLGPTIIVNGRPTRDIVFEAPHVPFELGTGEQAVALLRDVGGRAAIIAGAHRCASRTLSSCSGKTAVCGTLQAYRDSDAGHNLATEFNRAHIVFSRNWDKSLAVSLHGMKEGGQDEPVRLIVSNGIESDDLSEQTAATKLRVFLEGRLGPPGTVVNCNLPSDADFHYRKLCGYTNVQGRQINGGADTCGSSVKSGTGRFIHLEQDWSILHLYAYDWLKVSTMKNTRWLTRAFQKVAPSIARSP